MPKPFDQQKRHFSWSAPHCSHIPKYQPGTADADTGYSRTDRAEQRYPGRACCPPSDPTRQVFSFSARQARWPVRHLRLCAHRRSHARASATPAGCCRARKDSGARCQRHRLRRDGHQRQPSGTLDGAANAPPILAWCPRRPVVPASQCCRGTEAGSQKLGFACAIGARR